MPGDQALKKDLDYLIRNKPPASSLADLRNMREADEARAAQLKREARERIAEEARLAREKALEAFILANVPEHIMITVQGRRLKKLKDMDDIKCHKCGEALYSGKGMVREVAEGYWTWTNDTTRDMPPLLKTQAIECNKCNEKTCIIVQAVY